MNKPIRILLVDDHALVRAGIRSLLANIAGVEVVAEAGDGREALKLVGIIHPDVVVMDVAMPGLNGLEATALILRDYPDTRIVVLSMHSNEEYVLRALQAGALGYLLKRASSNDLEQAILKAAKREIFLGPEISKQVIKDYVRRIAGGGDAERPQPGQLDQLTARQREILQLIAEGKTTKEIASVLNLSFKTVETHRTQLMSRLDIHEVAGLVRYAIRTGVVTLE